MRCRCASVLLSAVLLACERAAPAPRGDTPVVMTVDEWEASLGLPAVRDSAEAATRALTALQAAGSWGAEREWRVLAVRPIEHGHLVHLRWTARGGATDTTSVVIGPHGGLYELEYIR